MGRTLPWTLRGNAALPTPGFWTSEPRTVRSNFCCVSTPSEWSFVMVLCRHPPRPQCWAGPRNSRQSLSRLDPMWGFLQAASDRPRNPSLSAEAPAQTHFPGESSQEFQGISLSSPAADHSQAPTPHSQAMQSVLDSTAFREVSWAAEGRVDKSRQTRAHHCNGPGGSQHRLSRVTGWGNRPWEPHWQSKEATGAGVGARSCASGAEVAWAAGSGQRWGGLCGRVVWSQSSRRGGSVLTSGVVPGPKLLVCEADWTGHLPGPWDSENWGMVALRCPIVARCHC